jgi:hypothetical protein
LCCKSIYDSDSSSENSDCDLENEVDRALDRKFIATSSEDSVTLPANKNYEKPKNVVDTILLDNSEYDSDNLLVDSSSSDESEHRCDDSELNTHSGKKITTMTKVVVSGKQARGEFIGISIFSRFLLL